ncbi:hypothetical protein Sros01_77710, partial [Streptomyces roseochromogenus]|jgi:hypothetical protein
LQP